MERLGHSCCEPYLDISHFKISIACVTAYTSDWSCYNQFTNGQIERMTGQYELYRIGNGTLMPSKSPTTNAPTVFQCKRVLRLCKSDTDCCSGNCGILFNIIQRCTLF